MLEAGLDLVTVKKSDTFIGRVSGRLQQLKDDLEAQRKNLAHTDRRIEEEQQKLESQLAKEYPKPDIEAERRRQWEKDRQRIREEYNRLSDEKTGPVPEQGREKVKGVDLDR